MSEFSAESSAEPRALGLHDNRVSLEARGSSISDGLCGRPKPSRSSRKAKCKPVIRRELFRAHAGLGLVQVLMKRHASRGTPGLRDGPWRKGNIWSKGKDGFSSAVEQTVEKSLRLTCIVCFSSPF